MENEAFEKTPQTEQSAENGAENKVEQKEPTETKTQPENGDKAPRRKYTDEDVNRIIAQTIAKEREKADKEKASITEAQKLEQMNAQEKAEYANKKLQEEVDALKREKNLNEQMAVARKELADSGINMSDELLLMFVSPEAEQTNVAIGKIKELWVKEVGAAVQDALKRTSPPADKAPAQGKSHAATFASNYSNKMNGGK